MKPDPYLTQLTKINSKLIKGLKLGLECFKLWQESIGQNALTLVLQGLFLIWYPKVQAIKGKINKWDHIKLLHSERNNELQQNWKII